MLLLLLLPLPPLPALYVLLLLLVVDVVEVVQRDAVVGGRAAAALEAVVHVCGEANVEAAAGGTGIRAGGGKVLSHSESLTLDFGTTRGLLLETSSPSNFRSLNICSLPLLPLCVLVCGRCIIIV